MLLAAVVSGCAGLALLAAGRRVLPVPAGWTAAAWETWWKSVGPLVAVFAVARVALVAVAAALCFAFLGAAVVVTGGRSGMIRRAQEAQQWPVLGILLRLALVAGAAGCTLAGCGSGPGRAPGGSREAAPTLTDLDPVPGLAFEAPPAIAPAPAPAPGLAFEVPPATLSTPAAAPAPAARPGDRSPAPGTSVATASSGPERTGGPPAGPPPLRHRVVHPGDSLWSIAEAEMGPGSDRVAGYWARLVALNRPSLPDPADPSLLFPGDTIVLPPQEPVGP